MSERLLSSREGRVTAAAFWDAFADALRAVLTESGRWPLDYGQSTAWTNVMKQTCRAVGQALGFHPNEIYFEYMKVDCGFFSKHPEEPGKRWCNWDWEVAIEYESNEKIPSGWEWLEEFTRLTHLNAGLKVIITYINFTKSVSDPLNESIDEAIKIYRQRKYRRNGDEWIFIFGPRCTELLGNEGIDFRAFAWTGGGHPVELASRNIIPSLTEGYDLSPPPQACP